MKELDLSKLITKETVERLLLEYINDNFDDIFQVMLSDNKFEKAVCDIIADKLTTKDIKDTMIHEIDEFLDLNMWSEVGAVLDDKLSDIKWNISMTVPPIKQRKMLINKGE